MAVTARAAAFLPLAFIVLWSSSFVAGSVLCLEGGDDGWAVRWMVRPDLAR